MVFHNTTFSHGPVFMAVCLGTYFKWLTKQTTDSLSPWHRLLFEQLKVTRLVEELLEFTELLSIEDYYERNPVQFIRSKHLYLRHMLYHTPAYFWVS